MSASKVLFIFIVFSMVVGGLLLIVGNMTAQPLGTGTYGVYTNFTDNSTINRTMLAVGTVTSIETGAAPGVMIMIAAIVVIVTVMMFVTMFGKKRH